MGARLASNWAMGKEQHIGLPHRPMRSLQAEKKKNWGESGLTSSHYGCNNSANNLSN